MTVAVRRAWRSMSALGVLLASASILLSVVLFDRISSEGDVRRDQTCRLFESDHLQDVIRLKRTYEYLGRLPRREYGRPLTVAIVQGLPALEDEARTDTAPVFCDEPGVGLLEPDPRLPEKRDFSHVLKRP